MSLALFLSFSYALDIMTETKVNQLDNGECRHQQKKLTTNTYNAISDAPSLVFMSATERHTTTPKIQTTLTSPGCDVKRNPGAYQS